MHARSLLLLLAAGACTHDAPTTPLANTPARTGVDDDLALIPAKASFVLRVDGTTLRASPIYAQLIVPALAGNPELTLIKSTCGFDPFALVTSMTVAAVGGMSGDGGAELVVHGIPRDRALACLPKLVAQPPTTFTVSQDHDTWIVSSTDSPMAIRFVGDSVALIVIGPTASQAGTDALLAGRATALPTSASFSEMHANLHAANWFVITPPAILDLVGMNGVRATFGSVDLGDGVTLDATMRFDTTANAGHAARELKTQSVELRAFTTRFDVHATGTEIRISARVERDKLVDLVRQMAR